MPVPVAVVIVLEAIVVELVAEGGVWVIHSAWNRANRKPVLNFTRPRRLYDEKTGYSYILQSNGAYRRMDGPRQV